MSLISSANDVVRQINITSPLRVFTVQHAFIKRTTPRYLVGPWRPNPIAREKHKWRTVTKRRKGPYYYAEGPLWGHQLDGWPDPGLLGARELVQTAANAQEKKVESLDFWQRIAERARTHRDLFSATEIATLLDTLVTGGLRHTDLMGLLEREIIADVDKFSFTELAVVCNAYAHFNVHSSALLKAFSGAAVELLTAPALEEHSAFDPRSLPVFVKALATLKFHDKDVLAAVAHSVEKHADTLSFAELVQILVAFVDLWEPFHGNDAFWENLTGKVPGARVASLCSMLRVLAVQHSRSPRPKLRRTLVAEIMRVVEGEGAQHGAEIAPHRSQKRLPAFVPPSIADELFTLAPSAPSVTPASSVESQSLFSPDVVVWEPNLLLDGGLSEVTEQKEQSPDAKKRRWYNAVSRHPFGIAGRGYIPFNASDSMTRNRRGAMLAEALDGLNHFWRSDEKNAGGQKNRNSNTLTGETAAGISVVKSAQNNVNNNTVGGETVEVKQKGAEVPNAKNWNEARPSKSANLRNTSEAKEMPIKGEVGVDEAVKQDTGVLKAGDEKNSKRRIPRWMNPAESDFLNVAAPLLVASIEGITPKRLVSCAEIYAVHMKNGCSDSGAATINAIAGEATRKLSNFYPRELMRLRDALLTAGISNRTLGRLLHMQLPPGLKHKFQDASSRTESQK